MYKMKDDTGLYGTSIWDHNYGIMFNLLDPELLVKNIDFFLRCPTNNFNGPPALKNCCCLGN